MRLHRRVTSIAWAFPTLTFLICLLALAALTAAANAGISDDRDLAPVLARHDSENTSGSGEGDDFAAARAASRARIAREALERGTARAIG